MKKKLQTPIMKQKNTPKKDLLNDILSSLTYQNKRLHNLIEMSADGEITRDIFKAKKQEIEEAAIEYLIELCDSQNFAHYSNTVMENFLDKEKIIIEHLKRGLQRRKIFSDTELKNISPTFHPNNN